MSAGLTLILVEDNIAFRDEMAAFLRRQRWLVHGVDSGEELSEWLQSHTPDIAVLDVNLPYEDGFSIAQRLRESFPHVGIVMLTARSRNTDRSEGYHAGADVYLAKPTNPNELVAVIQNLARRIHRTELPTYELRRASQTLLAPNQASCRLTATEFALLELLVLSPHRQAHREYLLDQLSVRLHKPFTADTLMVTLSRLRSKCLEQLAIDQVVMAERSVGYRLLIPMKLVG